MTSWVTHTLHVEDVLHRVLSSARRRLWEVTHWA